MNRTTTVLLGAAALVGWAVPAWGEVSAKDPTVPKDAESEITFVVPVGEDGGQSKAMRAMDHPQKPGPGTEEGKPSAVYNQKVEIEVPRGFEVVSCDQTADWKCEAAPNEGSPSAGQAHGGTITFTRVTGSGSSMDHLSFTVRTPDHIGTYHFPTTQTLSDGEETDWKGDGVTSEHPAPTVKVVDEDNDADPGHERK